MVFHSTVKPDERALLLTAYRRYELKCEELRPRSLRLAKELGSTISLSRSSSFDSIAHHLEANLRHQQSLTRELQHILHATIHPKSIVEAGLSMYPVAMSSVEMMMRCMPVIDAVLGDQAFSTMNHASSEARR